MWLDEIKKILKSLFDLALPAFCCECKEVLEEAESIVCTKCYSNIPKINTLHIDAFINRIPNKYFDDVTILFEYNELFQKLMHLYKYQEYLKLAHPFSLSISNQIQKQYDIITYVPLHDSKERERGYNQSQIIAQLVSANSGLTFGQGLLSRHRYTTTQTKLSRLQRIENVNEAFFVEMDVYNKSILIIDDVITTGATLNECAKVLKKAGCIIVDVLALTTPTAILE